MKTNIPTEHEEQIVFIQWLRLSKIFHFAVVNENQQSSNNKFMTIKTAQKHKKAGRLSGVSDVIVMLPDIILFIEMKRIKGGVQSRSQKEFEKNVEQFKYAYYFVANGSKEAIEIVNKFR
jgi:hypothetical protein